MPREFVTLIILLLSMVTLPINGRPSDQIKEASKHICKKNGRGLYQAGHNRWCCLCEAGRFKDEDCKFGLPMTTICKNCTFDPSNPMNQTYTDDENNSTQCVTSLSEDECLQKMNTRFVLGSFSHASRCVCKDGYYSASETLNYGCNEHSLCKPGFYPLKLGTNTTDTKCMRCLPGTFSNESSSTALCRPFSNCTEGEIEADGTSTSDVICTKSNNSFVLDEPKQQPPTNMTQMVVKSDVAVENSQQNLLVPVLVPTVTLVMIIVVVALFACRRNHQTCANKDIERCSASSIYYSTEPNSNTQSASCHSDEISQRELLAKTTTSNSQEESLLKSASDGDDMVLSSEDEDSNDLAFQEPCNGSLLSPRQDPLESEGNRKTADSTSNNDMVMNKPTENLVTICQEILELLKKRMNVSTITTDIEKLIEILLEDEKIGSKMMKCLVKFFTKDVLPYVRNFLTNTEIDDIQKDHRGNEREIRHQWLYRCTLITGRTLTPSCILNFKYEKDSFLKAFRDAMLDIFVVELQDNIQQDKALKINRTETG